ncbi:MAG TPA: response regulator transcription factor [Lachnospiraceae bacterium]|nr:response regulator transcription factor [Lachnospiraceae bacterium]
MLVCLAEDDPFFQSVIKELVCGAGYEFSGVRSCREFYALKEVPDLYILDINLPDGNGTDLCREIRRVSHTPVLFLTVKDTDADIVEGFAAGADDYITKPFVPAVFRARVSALLRRSAWNGCSKKHFMSGDLKIDLQDRRLFKGENEVPLFPPPGGRISSEIIYRPGSAGVRVANNCAPEASLPDLTRYGTVAKDHFGIGLQLADAILTAHYGSLRFYRNGTYLTAEVSLPVLKGKDAYCSTEGTPAGQQ